MLICLCSNAFLIFFFRWSTPKSPTTPPNVRTLSYSLVYSASSCIIVIEFLKRCDVYWLKWFRLVCVCSLQGEGSRSQGSLQGNNACSDFGYRKWIWFRFFLGIKLVVRTNLINKKQGSVAYNRPHVNVRKIELVIVNGWANVSSNSIWFSTWWYIIALACYPFRVFLFPLVKPSRNRSHFNW